MAKGKRRGAGEGSIRWREDLGVWECRVSIPVKLRPLYGTSQKSLYAKKQKDLLEKVEAFRRDLREGKRPSDLTVAAYLTRWLESLEALGTVAERTLQDYKYYAETHLIPPNKIGTAEITELTAEDLDSLYARLMKDGMGPRGVNHVHSTARVALQRAVKKRLIPYNPVRDADPPHYSTDDREYILLSEEGVGCFFEAAKGDRFEALFVAAVLAGFRPAELRALNWEDLALPGEGEGSAHVWRSAVELKGQPPKVKNSTKTGKRRYVPLLSPVVSALKAHRARQNEERLVLGELWRDQGLVFPTTTGTVVSKSNLARRHFKPILAKAGLSKEIRLYDLRHSFATLWVDGGEQIETLSGILGHARKSTTADRYVHPSDKARSDAMSRFGKRFRAQEQ